MKQCIHSLSRVYLGSLWLQWCWWFPDRTHPPSRFSLLSFLTCDGVAFWCNRYDFTQGSHHPFHEKTLPKLCLQLCMNMNTWFVTVWNLFRQKYILRLIYKRRMKKFDWNFERCCLDVKNRSRRSKLGGQGGNWVFQLTDPLVLWKLYETLSAA